MSTIEASYDNFDDSSTIFGDLKSNPFDVITKMAAKTVKKCDNPRNSSKLIDLKSSDLVNFSDS